MSSGGSTRTGRSTEIIGPRDVLEELQHYLFFKPLPFVSRVVFMATPHRGSDLSRGDGRPGRHQPDLRSGPHPQAARSTDQGQPRRLRLAAVPPLPDEHRDPRDRLADPAGPPEDEARPAAWTSTRSSGRIRPTGVAQSTDGVVPYRARTIDLAPPQRTRRWCDRTTASRRPPRRSSRSAASSASTWAATQARTGRPGGARTAATSP